MNTLKEHLSLETEGYSCTIEMTLNVLLKAAVDRSSLEAACADLEQVASSNRLREQLNQALDVADLRQHECELNAALASAIPPHLTCSGLESRLIGTMNRSTGKRRNCGRMCVAARRSKARPASFGWPRLT
jgi:hypothetical protein